MDMIVRSFYFNQGLFLMFILFYSGKLASSFKSFQKSCFPYNKSYLKFDDDQNQEKIGIIIIDHGSKIAQANNMLLNVIYIHIYYSYTYILTKLEKILTIQLVNDYKVFSGYSIVEAAHMELAEPTIKQGFRY